MGKSNKRINNIFCLFDVDEIALAREEEEYLVAIREHFSLSRPSCSRSRLDESYCLKRNFLLLRLLVYMYRLSNSTAGGGQNENTIRATTFSLCEQNWYRCHMDRRNPICRWQKTTRRRHLFELGGLQINAVGLTRWIIIAILRVFSVLFSLLYQSKCQWVSSREIRLMKWKKKESANVSSMFKNVDFDWSDCWIEPVCCRTDAMMIELRLRSVKYPIAGMDF